MGLSITRRGLLRTAAALTAVPAPAASYGRILGANDRIRVALIGCGNRGTYLMTEFQRFPDVEIVAVCDVFGEKANNASQLAGGVPRFGDHRKVVERGDLDAVVIATPDHWHVPIAIDAMNAAKDVYVEKPLTFRREEGPAIIHAAEANRRICQVGMQQRSGELFLRAKREIFDRGLLGKVSFVHAVWHYSEPFDLGDPNEPKPASLDWDRFLGQISWRPWQPHQYHHYRLFLDYGGASMTDLFTHWIDVIHMLMGRDRPRSVTSAGGIFVAKDDRTAPDTVHVLADYDGFTVCFESASLPGMPGEYIEFFGTGGQLWISRRKYQFTPLGENAKPVVVELPDTLVPSHIRNFLECTRTRNAPNCDARLGHRAAEVCLLARQAYIDRCSININRRDAESAEVAQSKTEI